MRQLLVDDTGDLTSSIQAPVADPLWTIWQQYSMGELRGESVGSVVRAEVETETVPIPLGSKLIEHVFAERRDQLDSLTKARLLAEIGLSVLSWMRARDPSTDLAAIRTDHPLVVPDAEDDLTASLLARASIDPLSLLAAAQADGTDTDLISLIEDLVEDNLPGEDSSLWVDTSFYVNGEVTDGVSTTIGIQELDEGPLGWWHLELLSLPGASTRTTTETLPLGLSFAGMPARRYWAMEDAQVHFGGVESESDALSALIVAEFAMVYGDDWHVIPMRVERGNLLRIISVVVTDSFGETCTIHAAQRCDVEVGRLGWTLWHLDGEVPVGDSSWSTKTTGPWLALLPQQLGHDGGTLERVSLFPDESANIAWAREEELPRWLQDSVDSTSAQTTRPVDTQSETLVWTLMNEVPSGQFPMLPRSRVVGTGEPAQIDLVVGRVTGSTDSPQSQLITELYAEPVPEESVRSPGVLVERRWHRTRETDGTAVMYTRRGGRVRGPAEIHTVTFDAVEPGEVTDE